MHRADTKVAALSLEVTASCTLELHGPHGMQLILHPTTNIMYLSQPKIRGDGLRGVENATIT